MVRQAVIRAGLAGLALAALLGCAAPATSLAIGRWSATSEPPAAPRELRAAWVATVGNIDWPSARGLSSGAQQAEARALIGKARRLGLNALFLQVRPSADALYPSSLEPWSEYLSGRQGQGPEPAYDPLAFWITEAHAAGMELHAWFNPYRVRAAVATGPLAGNHLAKARPDLVRAYGDQLWLDPGEPEAAAHVLRVILDVVRRYDLDGVHLDDYFYPYPVKDAEGRRLDFPDEPAWRAYQAGGGSLARADWRRSNVDRFIEGLYHSVHALKPQVRVGISPFGLGRPDRRPPGITGFSQYDELYADAERWLEQGWLDYLAPQLYWKAASPGQPFQPLLDYWRAQNPRNRNIWPGLFTSRAGGAEPWPAAEIAGEIQLSRAGTANPGHAHFSLIALARDFGGIDALLAECYLSPSLVPASPWLPAAVPASPRAFLKARDGAFELRPAGPESPWMLAVWAQYGPVWRFFTAAAGRAVLPALSEGQPLGRVLVSAVGRTGLEGPRVELRRETP